MSKLKKGALMGDLRPAREVAEALNVTTNRLLGAARHLGVRTVKVFGKPHISPTEFRRALDEASGRNIAEV